ncbi:MAG: twin-arginine translocase TatA/TatE family subunit [Dehalococcoidia bacterium]|nr:twin-arginine translocase TatA/TatE family subunit [Dehalococcoidia bacterium]
MGPYEIIIIVVALMLIFGAARLPKMGASLGQGLRAFKGALTGKDDVDISDDKDEKATSKTTEKESA